MTLIDSRRIGVLAGFDAKTKARIEDATVSLTVSGPGHFGRATLPLEPMRIEGATTYGGYVSLRDSGRHGLTFRVARAGPQHDPARAVFSYEQAR